MTDTINTNSILKKANLKVTPIRQQVLALFSSASHALGNQEIESNIEDVDRITLYRTLKSFEEKGVIHKINDLAGQTKYAMCAQVCIEHQHHNHKSHVHFQCDVCENTYCVEHVQIPSINLPKNFKVTGQNITMTGVCDKCI
jgi:Fur family transcriptional regulator, ferric uptake regulator